MVFQSTEIHYCCLTIKMRWFITYTMPCNERNMAKHWQMSTYLSSSGRSIWCLAGDMFWHKNVGCRPMDSIQRPTSLNYAQKMIKWRLETYSIPFESSHRAKQIVPEANLGGFRCQFWLNWRKIRVIVRVSNILGLILGLMITFYVTIGLLKIILEFES